MMQQLALFRCCHIVLQQKVSSYYSCQTTVCVWWWWVFVVCCFLFCFVFSPPPPRGLRVRTPAASMKRKATEKTDGIEFSEIYKEQSATKHKKSIYLGNGVAKWVTQMV